MDLQKYSRVTELVSKVGKRPSGGADDSPLIGCAKRVGG